MKLRIVLAAAFAVVALSIAACGGGDNNTGNASTNTPADNSGGKAAAPDPAALRAAVVKTIVDGFKNLDSDSIKAVWHPDQRELFEQRIEAGVSEIKEDGGSWTAKPGEITEEDGGFVVPMEFEIEVDGKKMPQKRALKLTEHEGKWVAGFHQ